MLLHARKLIEPYCKTVAISGYKPEYLPFKIDIVHDQHSGCGPISGIYSCLKHSSSPWNLLISVDTPFINNELIDYLLLHPGNFDCIIPQHAYGIEPSIGLYHRQIIPLVEESINKREFKLQLLLSKLNTCYLDCNFLIKKYPRLFFNMNKPEDFESV